jgi:hypothetical protein
MAICRAVAMQAGPTAQSVYRRCLSKEAPSPEAAVAPELVDELDARGVSGELLLEWADLETRILSRRSQDSGKSGGNRPMPLQPELREAAVQLLMCLADDANLPPGGWLDTAVLVDLCYLSGRAAAEVLPEVCAAAVALIKKSGDSSWSFMGPVTTGFAHRCAPFASWMVRKGYREESHGVSHDGIIEQERNLLVAVQWKINRPSVHTWLRALVSRFSVLTQGFFASYMEWIFSQSMSSAVMLVTRYALSAEMSAQRMARGLLCVWLVAAGVIPLGALRPTFLSESDWEDLFGRSQCQGRQPTCITPESRRHDMLELLRVVTGSELCNLQVDVHAVVEAMLAVAEERRRPKLPNVDTSCSMSASASRASDPASLSRWRSPCGGCMSAPPAA